MDLVQIVEAIIFASPDPVTAQDVARALRRTAKATLAAEEEAAALIAEAGQDTEAEEQAAAAKKKKGRRKKEKVKEPSETDPEVLQKISGNAVCEIIDEINETYNATGRPMHLQEGPSGWRFYTRSEYAHYIRGLMPEVKPERFSGPAMETLAIIAYRQPITKADIEAVRGVSVDGVLNKIIDKGLVKIAGRAELPGKPLLYETSETFLEHFGIKNIDDLPNSSELKRVELPTAELPLEDDGKADEQLSLGAQPGSPPSEEVEAEADDQETGAVDGEQDSSNEEGAEESDPNAGSEEE
ncbi:MAG: SMC-Scp complex subunit ScpB [Verrucomicrobiales bacterium]|nr:SMC-Scp complex subunit ScpB [Verrucomicrobiales bacterium]